MSHYDDLLAPRDPALQIIIVRTIIANLEKRLNSVSSPEVRDKATKLLNVEQQRLNKYRNQYPEYFV